MKQLSELGISPLPWKCVTYRCHAYGLLGEVKTAEGVKMAVDLKARDAIMFAAAPKMYEALRELYLISLEPVGGTREEREKQCKKYEEAFDNARAALMEASGESDVKQ